MNHEQNTQLQMMGTQLQQMQQYMQALEEQTQEVANAITSMEELETIEEGTETYIPLTNGIYVKAKLAATKEYLINVGNNITTIQTPEQAKKLLLDQQKELKKVQEQVVGQFSQMYQQYMQLQIRQAQ